MNDKKTSLITLFFTIDVLALDQLSKRLAVVYQGSEIEIMDRFFWLEFYQTNTGIAFGLPVPRWIQLVLTFFILAVLLHYGRVWIFGNQKHPFLKSLLFGMILGGALGNLIDRIFQGYVVDFIHLGPIPTFNIADIGIVLGVIGLMLVSWLEENTVPESQKKING